MSLQPEREALLSYFITLLESGDKYITDDEYRAGLKYDLFDSVDRDETTGMATAVFRGHTFHCPAITESEGHKDDPDFH